MNTYKGYNVGVPEAPADGSAYVRQSGTWVVSSGGTAEVFAFDTFGDFPATGTSNAIYIDKQFDLSYYWTGSEYSEISSTHNDLVGLQGGDTDEFYHLTAQEVALVEGINGSTSVSLLSPITVTDNGDGTVSVSSCTFLLKESTDLDAKAHVVTLAGIGPVALTLGKKYFLVADWDGGTPIQRIEESTSSTINDYTVGLIGILTHGVGGDIYWTDIGQLQLDGLTKLTRRVNGTDGLIVRTSGGIVSSSAGRYLQITAGGYFVSTKPETVVAFDSSGTDRFSQLHGDSTAGFTETTNLQQINNTQYWNTATNTLDNLSTGKFAVRWVFQLIDSPDEVYVFIGTAQYVTLASARSALLTNDLPIQLQQYLAISVLIAKVIVQQGRTDVIEVDNIVNINTQSITTSDHNQLSSLQGGAVDEYYHLTGAEQETLSELATGRFSPTTDSTTAFRITKADETTSVMSVDTTNGRVGIGTTTPSYTLDISGTGRFSGALTASSFVIPTSAYTTAIAGSATANRTITLPNASGTVALLSTSNTWTASNDFTTFKIKNSTFLTTIAGSATTDRTITLPDASGTVVLKEVDNNFNAKQTFGNSLSYSNTETTFYASNDSSRLVIGGGSAGSTSNGPLLIMTGDSYSSGGGNATLSSATRINFNIGGTTIFSIVTPNVVSSPGIYANTTASAANVFVASNGDIARSTSALKYKDDVQDIEESSWIHGIKPITYISKCEHDDKSKRHFGIIADQVDALCEDGKMLVSYEILEDGTKQVEGFQYERLTVLLLAELQKLRKDVDELKAQLNT